MTVMATVVGLRLSQWQQHLEVGRLAVLSPHTSRCWLHCGGARCSAVQDADTLQEEDTRVVRVAVVGPPNAGKSTLVNSLMGRRVCAVSSKVHTTRRRMQAVAVAGRTQIVFVDTPGLVTARETGKHRLDRSFARDPETAVQRADVIAVVHDVSNHWTRDRLDPKSLRLLQYHRDKPAVLVLNKVDVLKSKRKLLDIVKALTNDTLQPSGAEQNNPTKNKLRLSEVDENSSHDTLRPSGAQQNIPTKNKLRLSEVDENSSHDTLRPSGAEQNNPTKNKLRLSKVDKNSSNDSLQPSKDEEKIQTNSTLISKVEDNIRTRDNLISSNLHQDVLTKISIRLSNAENNLPDTRNGNGDGEHVFWTTSTDCPETLTFEERDKDVLENPIDNLVTSRIQDSKRIMSDISTNFSQGSESGKEVSGSLMDEARENGRNVQLSELAVRQMVRDASGWPHFSEIFMVSALTGNGVDDLKEYLACQSRAGAWPFREVQFSDESSEQLVTDAVRAKLLDFLPREVPYNLNVALEYFKTGPAGNITAVVLIKCPALRIEKLVVGTRGSRIKLIAQEAEQDLRNTFQEAVYLRLVVTSK